MASPSFGQPLAVRNVFSIERAMVVGTPPVIDDGVVCTVDSCDEVADQVLNIPDDTACDDGLFCNGAEFCDVALDCQSGTAPVVDDGVPCTNDSCDEIGDVVVHVPDDALCDNGQACDGLETCDAVLGCQSNAPPAVDDGVACTIDTCDDVTGEIDSIAAAAAGMRWRY